jgi:hypothetical protein
MRRNGAPLEEAPEHRPSQHDVRALSATENERDRLDLEADAADPRVSAEYERTLLTQRLSAARKMKATAGGYALKIVTAP